MRLMDDRILVCPLEADEKTPGGVVIPNPEKPMRGKVIAVGPGAKVQGGGRDPVILQVGDVVLYSRYSGTEIKIEGVDHLVIREDDVLLIF